MKSQPFSPSGFSHLPRKLIPGKCCLVSMFCFIISTPSSHADEIVGRNLTRFSALGVNVSNPHISTVLSTAMLALNFPLDDSFKIARKSCEMDRESYCYSFRFLINIDNFTKLQKVIST